MRQKKVRIPSDTLEFLKTLHPDIKKKLKAGLKEIAKNPLSGKALKEELEGLRSFRVGKYRIVYREEPSALEIIAAGVRETIYEDTLSKLLKEKDANR
ncbi:MAG: type II toxin-antitoxin system RelE/ParE family toxin [Nitrospirae bacterium]|nr:type II toxin-antitoxin system RelE/ParE family toxin [Nitrospirota bacterium]